MLALYNFQELLTRHKMLAAEFLETNFDRVFGNYQKLLHSDNYVTRRQSLKLLGELLLDRHNFSVRNKMLLRSRLPAYNFSMLFSCAPFR